MLYFYLAIFLLIGGVITSMSDTAQNILLIILGIISVMTGMAYRTLPLPVTEREPFVMPATSGTGL